MAQIGLQVGSIELAIVQETDHHCREHQRPLTIPSITTSSGCANRAVNSARATGRN